MNLKKLILVLVLVMLAIKAVAGTYRPEETSETDPKTYAYVGPVTVAAPLNYFLILKKGLDICAIRFTDYRRGHDKRKPTAISGGEESLFAEYDWQYMGKDSKFLDKNGHVKLNSGSTTQILGFHGFYPGVRSIRCGSFSVGWIYPIAVTYTGSSGTVQENIEVGITPWTDKSALNLESESIRWYSYDEKRKRAFIHVKELFPENILDKIN